MNVWQIIVVIACIALFIGTFILNRKTKLKGDENMENIELPESCMSCHNATCLNQIKQEKKLEEINQIVSTCQKEGGKNDE